MIKNIVLSFQRPAQVRSYSDFVSHISQYQLKSTADSPGRCDVTDGSSSMWGSSWGHYYTSDSHSVPVAQHAFPTEQAYLSARASYPQVALAQVSYVGSVPTMSVSRNGLTSSSWDSYPCFALTKFLYYDPVQGPMQINPSIAGSPVPYTW